MWFVLVWLERDKMQKYYPRGLWCLALCHSLIYSINRRRFLEKTIFQHFEMFIFNEKLYTFLTDVTLKSLIQDNVETVSANKAENHKATFCNVLCLGEMASVSQNTCANQDSKTKICNLLFFVCVYMCFLNQLWLPGAYSNMHPCHIYQSCITGGKRGWMLCMQRR